MVWSTDWLVWSVESVEVVCVVSIGVWYFMAVFRAVPAIVDDIRVPWCGGGWVVMFQSRW